MRGDIEPFTVAAAFAEVVGFTDVLGGASWVTYIEITGADARVGHCEIGVELSSALKERDGGDVVALHDHVLEADAVGLKRFERGSGDAVGGRVEFLQGGQGLAELFANFGGGVAESFENLLFSGGGDLLGGELVAVVAIDGLEAEDILGAQAGDGAFNGSGAGSALADLTCDVGGEASISGLRHERESLCDFFIGQEIEEGRLFELRGEALT